MACVAGKCMVRVLVHVHSMERLLVNHVWREYNGCQVCVWHTRAVRWLLEGFYRH